MAVKIDMEMPESCSECKYKEGRYTDERYTCKLINITFPAEYVSRFALCPLQEVKDLLCARKNNVKKQRTLRNL